MVDKAASWLCSVGIVSVERIIVYTDCRYATIILTGLSGNANTIDGSNKAAVNAIAVMSACFKNFISYPLSCKTTLLFKTKSTLENSRDPLPAPVKEKPDPKVI